MYFLNLGMRGLKLPSHNLTLALSLAQPRLFSHKVSYWCVSGSREIQPFIFSHYPLPGRRLRIPGGPAVHLHSLSAARKTYPDPEWSRRSSSLVIRFQEGVSGPPLVQVFYLHSLSAARRAYPDPEWSRRSSSLAIRLQEGVSGPRGVQAFIFTRYPLPGRRIRTATCPAVHLHSLSAAGKAYADRDWSR